MEKYKLVYEITACGDSLQLLSVEPKSDYVENCFYGGEVTHPIYLNDDGVYELTVVHVFEEDYDYFGIVSLEKVYGR